MKKFVIALLLAGAQAEEAKKEGEEAKKGAAEHYACDSSTENTGCAEKLRCQLRPALVAYWTEAEVTAENTRRLTKKNADGKAAADKAIAKWKADTKQAADWKAKKAEFDDLEAKKQADIDANAAALKNYNESLAECSKGETGSDAAAKAAAYTTANKPFGADPDTKGKFLCTDTTTGPVTFTPNKDGSDKVVAAAAGTPIATGAQTVDTIAGVEATIAFTSQADSANDLTQYVRTGVTWAQGDGQPVTDATKKAYLALSADGNAIGAAGGDAWTYYGKTSAGVAFDAAALTLTAGKLPATTMTDKSTDFPQGTIPNPKFVQAVKAVVAADKMAPGPKPADWAGFAGAVLGKIAKQPVVSPVKEPAAWKALTKLADADKAKPEDSRAGAAAAPAKPAAGEAKEGEAKKEEEDPADGPGVCVAEAECDKEDIFCGATKLAAGLIVSLAVAASL